MNRLTRKLSLVPAVLALLCFSGPVAAQVARNQVPFMGTVEGVALPVFTDPCNRPVTLYGAGQASHLGRFAWASTLTATDLCPVVPNFTVTGGKVTLTAANGAQLFGTYTGSGLNPGSVGPPFLVLLDLAVTITGGTGTFLNTTGSFRVSMEVDTLNLAPPPHPFTATLVGSFSSAAKN